ncbi:MAG: ABC transporter permease [Chloroflexi bacterium]|nr:ABC transporter permease [Chloroflexota bacterium]MDA1147999.1 ABC transporter permease [Chloroflexota bacterium]
MQRYFARRVMLAIPTIFFVMFATFAMVRFVPGDVVELILAENPYATEEDANALRKQLGLDQPIPIQFARYVGDLAQGDMGESPWTGRAITTELKGRLPITLEFGLFAVILGLFVALPVGIISAIRQDTLIDYVARSFAILSLSVPYFFTATLLVIFPVIWWGWSPPLTYAGWSEGIWDHVYYMFFPALLLGVNLSGSVMRMTRTMVLEVMRQDYIRTAYAKGLRERTVLTRHAMKNALIPVVTIIGLQVGTALSGTLIIETIFNMPGVGRYFIGAILARDYPSVQGVVLVLATVVVFVNLAVDLVYAAIDPRISYA